MFYHNSASQYTGITESGNVQCCLNCCVGKHWGELPVLSVFKVILTVKCSSLPGGKDSTQAAGISGLIEKDEGTHENFKGWGCLV